MIYGWKKYGLSREDFIRYREYFLKTLEKSWTPEEQDKSVTQKHDKSFKEILSNKKEMSMFLKQFVGIKATTDELEEQKNTYINKQFEKRESDIIYKIRNKQIYILIEHQSKIDKKMPRRIFEYCMGIMMGIEKNNTLIDGHNPIIIPIVIYTGCSRWNVATNFSDTQKTYQGLEEYKINLNYKLIDINKYSNKELIEKDTKLTSIMVLEKCKTSQELKNEIVKMLLLAQCKEKIIWIEQLVKYVFIDKLGEDGSKILEILKKGEMSDMEDLLERIEINEEKIRKKLIKKGEQAGKKEGIIETITSIIKNMIQENEDEEKIMKYTNAKIEDIRQMKKELGM